MEDVSNGISTVMRDIVAVCEVPVIVLLLIGVLVIIVCVGSLIGELVTEHRHFKVFLPKLVDDLEKCEGDSSLSPVTVIKKSGLLLRQKRYLIELLSHPDLSDEMRESLAVGIENEERRRYDVRVKITEIISRIAPLVGLLGTLIPLGPGIMALGEGNTEQLSASLLTAFDTTSLGLIIAAFAIVITAIRKRWYKDYMVTFDALIECVLDVEKNHAGKKRVVAQANENGENGKGSFVPFRTDEQFDQSKQVASSADGRLATSGGSL